jgi:hypothetical protein
LNITCSKSLAWYTRLNDGDALNQSRSLVSLIVLALFGLILVGLVWASYRFAHFDISGEGFSIQWISMQSLEKGGTDPYSDQITSRIRQTVLNENAFVRDIYPKYTSPLYSGVLIFPFTLIRDIILGHALWLTTQLVLIFGMILLCVRMTAWKINRYSFFLFSLFTVFSFHIVIPWLDGGLPIWAAFFLVIALVAIGDNRNEVGGVFLALATVQPQMVVLPVIFILIWSISKKKAVIVLWFIITLVLLSAVGLFIVPGWIIQYIRLLYHFSENFPPGNPELFFSSTFPGVGKQLGWFVSGISIVILIIEWFLALRKDLRWFLWTVCLTMVIGQWVGIPTIPGNFIELIIPLILIFSMLTERWAVGGQWAAVIMVAILFVWEWGIFNLDLLSSQPAMQLNLIFPLPAVLLVGLYWVRWWAIRPRRLLIEELRLSESY